MRIIDPGINRQRNKTLKQNELAMWEKLSFVSLGIVIKVDDKKASVKLIPSLSYNDYDMKKGFTKINSTNEIVDCLLVEGLSLVDNDIVLVLFTDADSRETIDSIRRGRPLTSNFNYESTVYHNSNFGIVINKIAI